MTAPPQQQDYLAGQFPEPLAATAPLDCAGNALGEEQPPRDQIAIPCVHDDLNRLVK